jgi:uncharacterized protein involved in response to NO
MRPWLASAGAVAAGFLVTAVASTAADAISIPIEAVPCVWLGARLAVSRRSSARTSGIGH